MDLLHMRSFLAVAEHRTITRASRALGLTQPALTRRLQLLEEEVGAQLFERSRRGMALTDAGRLVADEARALVDRYTAMREQVRARLTLEKGVVRIGGGATAVSFVVPPAIARFQKKHPGVRFHVREAGSRDVEADVRDERIELGIVTLPLRSQEFDVVPLRRDRIVLVAAPDHPLARRRRVDAKDLAGQSFVGFEAGSAIRQLVDTALRDAGVEVNVQMELRSIAATLEMVAHTQSLAFVSQLGVAGRDTGVAVIDVKGIAIYRRLALISKLGRPLSPAAHAFSAMLA
jgi:DNA-binding transcriptional LysR family regulator